MNFGSVAASSFTGILELLCSTVEVCCACAVVSCPIDAPLLDALPLAESRGDNCLSCSCYCLNSFNQLSNSLTSPYGWSSALCGSVIGGVPVAPVCCWVDVRAATKSAARLRRSATSANLCCAVFNSYVAAMTASVAYCFAATSLSRSSLNASRSCCIACSCCCCRSSTVAIVCVLLPRITFSWLWKLVPCTVRLACCHKPEALTARKGCCRVGKLGSLARRVFLSFAAGCCSDVSSPPAALSSVLEGSVVAAFSSSTCLNRRALSPLLTSNLNGRFQKSTYDVSMLIFLVTTTTRADVLNSF